VSYLVLLLPSVVGERSRTGTVVITRIISDAYHEMITRSIALDVTHISGQIQISCAQSSQRFGLIHRLPCCVAIESSRRPISLRARRCFHSDIAVNPCGAARIFCGSGKHEPSFGGVPRFRALGIDFAELCRARSDALQGPVHCWL
jgi:hypothetical protein